MLGQSGNLRAGVVSVSTTNHRGHTPEEIADRAVERIISIADDMDPALQNQARAFRSQIRELLVLYMREAIKSDRTTVYNAIVSAGQKDLAEHLRRL